MQLTFSLAVVPANPSQEPDLDEDWPTPEEISCSHILLWLNDIAPPGWFGKTSPVFYHQMEDEPLPPCFTGWKKSGIHAHGECLTLNMSEHTAFPELCHNKDAVSSLWDILETGDVEQKFYLSAKACAGKLRRAERRNRPLPEQLHTVLSHLANMSQPLQPAPSAPARAKTQPT